MGERETLESKLLRWGVKHALWTPFIEFIDHGRGRQENENKGGEVIGCA
jgi:hypothetical protein